MKSEFKNERCDTKQTNSRRTLRNPSIYVRVRPTATGGGHADQTAVYKRLQGWNKKCVMLEDRHGVTNYDFSKEVFPPESSQEQVFQTSILELLKDFGNGLHNLVFFAYGQTGTGKTHSIFGTTAALESTTHHTDWGIFPLAVYNLLNMMRENQNSTTYTLEAQAVEFYMFECFDLLNSRSVTQLNRHNKPTGAKSMAINGMSDVMQYLKIVHAERTAAGTRMNEKSADHSGSSRSHCALILVLRQVKKDTNSYKKTVFNLVDLAGAERPGKNGHNRQAVFESLMAHYYGTSKSSEISSVASQAAVVNYELAELIKEVVKATDSHKQSRTYLPPFQLCSAAICFLAGCFNGDYLIGMLVCVSQAASCGWETWFSLQYGTDLSKLKAPSRVVKSHSLNAILKRAENDAIAAEKALKQTPKFGAPSSKYFRHRETQMLFTRHENGCLKELNAKLNQILQTCANMKNET